MAALLFTPVTLCDLLLLWYKFTTEMIDTELFKLHGVRRAGGFLHMLGALNPVSGSRGVCQPALQKAAFFWEEKCWLGFQMGLLSMP